jgi:type VI protein secretion system component Hcp
VDSFSWGETRTISTSRPTMDGFRITMPISTASPKLFLYTAGGTKIPRIVLSVKLRGSQQDFLKWTLTSAQVLSYQTVGNAHGDGVSDQVTFSFSKIDVEYRQPLPDGTLGPIMQGSWDQRTNKGG